MVNPLNLPYSPENINHRTEFDNGTAIGMPPISFSTRKNAPITNVNNSYEYNPSHNSSRRYSKNLAPSGILTEAFFKSRLKLLGSIAVNQILVRSDACTTANEKRLPRNKAIIWV